MTDRSQQAQGRFWKIFKDFNSQLVGQLKPRGNLFSQLFCCIVYSLLAYFWPEFYFQNGLPDRCFFLQLRAKPLNKQG